MQTNTITDNLPFANYRHRTKWIQRLNQYKLVDNDLYFTDIMTGKKYLVINKNNISPYLQTVWYDNKKGYRGRDAFYSKIKDSTVGITRAEVMNWLRKQEIHQLTYPTRHNTVIKPIVAKAPNQHWQMDLFDMQKFKSPQNNQAEYSANLFG